MQPLAHRKIPAPHMEKKMNEDVMALVSIQSYHTEREASSSKALTYQPKVCQLKQVVHCY